MMNLLCGVTGKPRIFFCSGCVIGDKMKSQSDEKRLLQTTAGDFPLDEFRLRLAGGEWSILHVAAVISQKEESHFLKELRERLPYGVTLWAAAIALAHEVASRADNFSNRRVLELGAGTGLPGIVAASFGARVVQTDRLELPMSVCKRNCRRNGVENVEHRLADWNDWNDRTRYDWIIGSDILYGEETHPHLRRIFENNLAPGGRMLLSDPFRDVSFRLLEEMEKNGWSITLSKWSVGDDAAPRQIAVFELQPA